MQFKLIKPGQAAIPGAEEIWRTCFGFATSRKKGTKAIPVDRGRIQSLSAGNYRSVEPGVAGTRIPKIGEVRNGAEPSLAWPDRREGQDGFRTQFLPEKADGTQQSAATKKPRTKPKTLFCTRWSFFFLAINEIWLKITQGNKLWPFLSPLQPPLLPQAGKKSIRCLFLRGFLFCFFFALYRT